MANYIIRERVFSFGDDFTIQDQDGHDVLYVDGKAFSLSDAMSVQDMAGNELALIRRVLFSFGHSYSIERDGSTSVVSKEFFTFFSCHFTVDVPGPGDLEAAGSFLDHDYTFTDGAGQTVAVIHKHWLTLSDQYGVEIAEGQDDVLILCAALVIDRICHEKK